MAVRTGRSRLVRAQGPGVCCEAKQTVEKQGENPLLKARDPTKTRGWVGSKWPDLGTK